MAYGMDHSRYAENKRAVKDKYLGPLVKTFMTRCIQCTRCVRFSSEIAGRAGAGRHRARREHGDRHLYRAGADHRAVRQPDRYLPGRRADLNKPYSFTARPWELRKTDSVDVHRRDGRQHPRRRRGPEVLRILPRLNDEVNEEWLGDKSRFCLDGLKRRRLDKPWVRRGRQAAPGDLARGVRRHRRPAEGRAGRADRRDRRRSVRCREHGRAEGPDGGAGLGQPRLPPGRRAARCGAPRVLPVQQHASPASRRPTRSCWSAATRGARRRC